MELGRGGEDQSLEDESLDIHPERLAAAVLTPVLGQSQGFSYAEPARTWCQIGVKFRAGAAPENEKTPHLRLSR
jgi:hypothetical protein